MASSGNSSDSKARGRRQRVATSKKSSDRPRPRQEHMPLLRNAAPQHRRHDLLAAATRLHQASSCHSNAIQKCIAALQVNTATAYPLCWHEYHLSFLLAAPSIYSSCGRIKACCIAVLLARQQSRSCNAVNVHACWLSTISLCLPQTAAKTLMPTTCIGISVATVLIACRQQHTASKRSQPVPASLGACPR
eukprot:1158120-Pelagomonas_calceolata.AAC.4